MPGPPPKAMSAFRFHLERRGCGRFPPCLGTPYFSSRTSYAIGQESSHSLLRSEVLLMTLLRSVEDAINEGAALMGVVTIIVGSPRHKSGDTAAPVSPQA